jgi:VanZ family protein
VSAGRPSGRSDAAGRARRWWPPTLWATGLLVATSWPNPNVPNVRSGDKVVHMVMYAGLAWLVARAEPGWVRRAAPLVLVAVAVSALGAVDEWHQQFIPGRSASAGDWLADSAGAVLALLAAALRHRQPA